MFNWCDESRNLAIAFLNFLLLKTINVVKSQKSALFLYKYIATMMIIQSPVSIQQYINP